MTASWDGSEDIRNDIEKASGDAYEQSDLDSAELLANLTRGINVDTMAAGTNRPPQWEGSGAKYSGNPYHAN